MNYKIGQKVRVKKNLKGNSYYGSPTLYFANEMEKYRGKVFTIIKITKKDHYRLGSGDLPNIKEWLWNDDMLEPNNSSLKDLIENV